MGQRFSKALSESIDKFNIEISSTPVDTLLKKYGDLEDSLVFLENLFEEGSLEPNSPQFKLVVKKLSISKGKVVSEILTKQEEEVFQLLMHHKVGLFHPF